jgi:hypothetical protein
MTIRQFGITLATVMFLPLLALGAAACGGAQGFATDVTEAAVATGGEDEFKKAGITLDGDLDCTATPSDNATTDADGVASDYSVSCTGTTADGKEVTLNGDTSNPPFVGKVDNEEVFSRDCLGDETC